MTLLGAELLAASAAIAGTILALHFHRNRKTVASTSAEPRRETLADWLMFGAFLAACIGGAAMLVGVLVHSSP
jgi:hypothetical protein